jgi:DNA-binding MarR family transcriptional regulator
MASSEQPPRLAVAGDDRSGERMTLRQAHVLEVLAIAGAPLSGEAIAAQLGVRAGSLSVTLRSLQRRGLIVAAARERARPGGWMLRCRP